jgi:hypothetical protein
VDGDPDGERYRISGELWEYGGEATWVFVTLPADISAEIREQPRPSMRGFGSIRVTVTLGGSSWATSIFPDSKTGCYVLPVKKAVRLAEGVDAGDSVSIELEPVE